MGGPGNWRAGGLVVRGPQIRLRSVMNWNVWKEPKYIRRRAVLALWMRKYGLMLILVVVLAWIAWQFFGGHFWAAISGSITGAVMILFLLPFWAQWLYWFFPQITGG